MNWPRGRAVTFLAAALSALFVTSTAAVADNGDDFLVPDRYYWPATSCDELWPAAESVYYSVEEPNQAQCWSWPLTEGLNDWSEVSYGWQFLPDVVPWNLVPWSLDVPWSELWDWEKSPNAFATDMISILDGFVADGLMDAREESFGTFYSWTISNSLPSGAVQGEDWGMAFSRSAIVYGPLEAVESMVRILPPVVSELEQNFIQEGPSFPENQHQARLIRVPELVDTPSPFSCEDFGDPEVVGPDHKLVEWDASGLAHICSLHLMGDDFPAYGLWTRALGFERDVVTCFDERALNSRIDSEQAGRASSESDTLALSVGQMTLVNYSFSAQELLDRPKVNGEPLQLGYLDLQAACIRVWGWPEAIVDIVGLLTDEFPDELSSALPSDTNNAQTSLAPTTTSGSGLPLSWAAFGAVNWFTALLSLVFGLLIAGVVGVGWRLTRRSFPLAEQPASSMLGQEHLARKLPIPTTAFMSIASAGIIAAAVVGPTVGSGGPGGRTLGDIASGLVVWGGGSVLAVVLTVIMAYVLGFRPGPVPAPLSWMWLLIIVGAVTTVFIPAVGQVWLPVALVVIWLSATSHKPAGPANQVPLLWGLMTLAFVSLIAATLLSPSGQAVGWFALLTEATGLIILGSVALFTLPLPVSPMGQLLRFQPALWAVSTVLIWTLWALVFIPTQTLGAWLVTLVIAVVGLVSVYFGHRATQPGSTKVSRASETSALGKPLD